MLFRKFWKRMSRRGISAAAMIAAGIGVLPGSAASAQPRFGDPLPGLNAAQISAFNAGKMEFEAKEKPQDGLGPIFNRDSCVACHSAGATGGASPILVTRFGRAGKQTFDELKSLGGGLLQEKAIDPSGLERVPREANLVVQRQSTPLFGLGLIEGIPDATILQGVRATPVDGVKGRASMVADIATGKNLVGRFGWKGQQATLLSFAGDAYLNEMGITSRLFPTENAPNGNLELLKKLDRVADPEDQLDPATGKYGIDKLADFMRLLSPPPSLPVTASTGFGGKIFLDIGCAACHTPMLTTGPSSIPALNGQRVMLFSDLLLHDMGSLGDGIGQGTATGQEMKTAPLWGLRNSGPYLHDGRAATVEDAIQAHDGESTNSRDRYRRLSPDQKSLLAQFLMSI